MHIDTKAEKDIVREDWWASTNLIKEKTGSNRKQIEISFYESYDRWDILKNWEGEWSWLVYIFF